MSARGSTLSWCKTTAAAPTASTNADRTNYFETLPANQLELGIFLEADRMRALNITQPNLDNQRQTVQEERRQNIDNRPYGRTHEAVIATAYANFAYQHSVIGSMGRSERRHGSRRRGFFRIYYAPNNAVLSLVGDFQMDVALSLIKKYFEEISAQPAPPVPDVAESEQKTERRKIIEDAFAQAPRLDIVYKIPPGNTPDWYALSVLGQVLSGGVSSRLYQKLIKDKEVALNVSAGPDERRGPSLSWFSITARPGTDLAALEKLIYEDIERLQNEEIADWELSKVQMQLRRQRAQQRYSTRARANAFGHYAVYYNDPQLINSAQQKYGQVTKSDLQRVARTYLKETQRTVVTTMPNPAAAKAPPDHR